MTKPSAKRPDKPDVDGLADALKKTTIADGQPPDSKTKTKKSSKKANKKIVEEWNEYIGDDGLPDWQRLCRDLGLEGDMGSKTKCKKILQKVNVNIRDFLDAKNKRGDSDLPVDVKFFHSVRELSTYTRVNNRIYPREEAKRKGGALKALLKHLF